jgi:chemotaxis protein methyltransferase CheR
MTGTLSRKSLAEFSEFVGARLGLSFPAERWDDLAGKIGLAARGMGYRDLEMFTRSVLSGQVQPGSLEALASHLTVGETFFYRDSKSLEALQHHVFPDILRTGKGDGQLRIWSAGCASGEEPYTIAMIVNDIPGFRDWKVTIVGSDINQTFLAKAEAGVYSEWSFRGVPDAVRARYFRKIGKTGFQILPEVRRMVDFEYLNLVGDEYPTLFSRTNAMDLIVCRNVLMYFRPDIIKQVVGKLQRSLLHGGWLVVSPVESPLIKDAALSAVQFPDAVLYCKRAPPEHPDTRGAPAAEQSLTERKSRTASRQASLQPPKVPTRSRTMSTPRGVPGSAEKRYAQALECFTAGQYDTCVSFLADPASGLGEDTKALELLARAHANAGRLADAETWCERAIRADKLNARLRYLLATVFIEQGRLERAAAALHRAIYIDPQFVVAHFALGQLMLRMGLLQKARSSLVNASTILKPFRAEEQVPESDGLSAGRLSEIVQSLLRERVEA